MGLLAKFQANPPAAITEISYGSMRSGFRGGGEGAVQLGELRAQTNITRHGKRKESS